MRKFGFAFAGTLALLLAAVAQAAPQSDSFAGTWEVAIARQGVGVGRGAGRGGSRGGDVQMLLTITQDGDTYKIIYKTPRGQETYDATVSDNTIQWTEERQGRSGNTTKIEFKGTLDGDTMTGTMSARTTRRDFTAKRK